MAVVFFFILYENKLELNKDVEFKYYRPEFKCRCICTGIEAITLSHVVLDKLIHLSFD